MNKLFFPENLPSDLSCHLELYLPKDTLIKVSKDVIGKHILYCIDYQGEDHERILPAYLDKDMEKMDEYFPFYIFNPSYESPLRG